MSSIVKIGISASRWTMFAFCLICALPLFSQGYEIENMFVKCIINDNGVVSVQEEITVDFSEKRRGIYRDIPLKYKTAKSRDGNAIIIENVTVVDDPYIVIDEKYQKRIRIGSPDKYLTGEKKYIIRYDVIGAIEQFNGNAEFPWQIVGNQWDTSIKNISVEYKMPFKVESPRDDILIYFADRQIALRDTEYSLEGNNLSIRFLGKLKARQGISVALRFKDHNFPMQEVPASVLADQYYIAKSIVELNLLNSGELIVHEKHRVRYLKNSTSVTRLMSSIQQDDDQHGRIYNYPEFMVANVNNNRVPVYADKSENGYLVVIPINSQSGRNLDLRYTLQGSTVTSNKRTVIWWDAASFEEKVPIDTIVISYNLNGASLASVPKFIGYETTKLSENPLRYQFIRKNFLYGQLQQRLILNNFEASQLYFPKNTLFDDILMEEVALDISCEDDCNIYQKIDLRLKENNHPINFYAGSNIDSRTFPYKVDNPSLLKKEVDLHVEVNPEKNSYVISSGREYVRLRSTNVDRGNDFDVNYKTSLLVDNGRLLVPIFSESTAPIDNLKISLTLEGESSQLAKQLFVQADSADGVELFEYNGFNFISVPLTQSQLTNLESSDRVGRFFSANKTIWLALLICGGLYWLWYRFGRDEKYDGSMESSPPDYMTPAEAGYLWDGKLHGRDLISLIYHWAAKGLLVIEEKDTGGKSPEYYLEKIDDLPVDANGYEKILFNNLFTTGESRVRISSLKRKFYSTMSKARIALKKEFEAKHLYEPLTRGVGVLFVILGVLIVGAGLVVLGLYAGRGDFSWSLPILIVGMACVFFGYYLPKKTALGSKYFISLQKFSAFIDEAKPEEISHLYENDSAYFQNTLAFAIVLGKAEAWSKRFQDLMQAPPDYYRGGQYDTFSPTLFADNVVKGMRNIERDLYSLPASSSSSSSYSGGRSSSFGGGGGFSGGGFGGGGGSSW